MNEEFYCLLKNTCMAEKKSLCSRGKINLQEAQCTQVELSIGKWKRDGCKEIDQSDGTRAFIYTELRTTEFGAINFRLMCFFINCTHLGKSINFLKLSFPLMKNEDHNNNTSQGCCEIK